MTVPSGGSTSLSSPHPSLAVHSQPCSDPSVVLVPAQWGQGCSICLQFKGFESKPSRVFFLMLSVCVLGFVWVLFPGVAKSVNFLNVAAFYCAMKWFCCAVKVEWRLEKLNGWNFTHLQCGFLQKWLLSCSEDLTWMSAVNLFWSLCVQGQDKWCTLSCSSS